MSKLNVDGSIEIYLAPSVNLISFLILIILIGDSLTVIPELIIFSINSFADPSRIGTSYYLFLLMHYQFPIQIMLPSNAQ